VKKIQLALYSSTDYMKCLADYFCRRGHNMMETKLFTSMELLEKQAESGKIDVLLADGETAGQMQKLKSKIAQVILLSEDDKEDNNLEFYQIFKYQPAQELVKEVLSCIAENDKIPFVRSMVVSRTVEFLGVYAPFGGGGVTEYALSMAKELAKHNRALFISLEPFQGLDFLFTDGKDEHETAYRGMSEIIFYLKQRKEKLALKLETVIFSLDGLDYILAVEDYRDLHSLNCMDMQNLLEVISGQTEYEKVIFDIGFFGEAPLYLMEQCSRLYMPNAITKQQLSKQRAFQRLLLREGKDTLIQAFQTIERERRI